jgi:hypothetical protein
MRSPKHLDAAEIFKSNNVELVTQYIARYIRFDQAARFMMNIRSLHKAEATAADDIGNSDAGVAPDRPVRNGECAHAISNAASRTLTPRRELQAPIRKSADSS